MISSEERMISTQAQKITELNALVKKLRDDKDVLVQKLNKIQPEATFYQLMAKAIMENPGLQEIWDQFTVMLKLVEPDADQWGHKANYDHIDHLRG